MGDGHAADITMLLGKLSSGDLASRDRLIPLVYGELEAIARRYINPTASIEPHGLVHELFLRISTQPITARDRRHFYATAALAMRQILADHARQRLAAKRGGDLTRVTLTGLAHEERGLDVVAVHDALARLEALSARQAQIVAMHCLVGMSITETAEALELSERTVYAEWRLARAWLTRELGDGTGP
jgi:RNA polymerase sigma factor (TIGR02999 family)